jgi:pyruvate dehydrogenase E1 component alpha subunit
MLRIRMVELAISARYGEGEMRCPTHLCIGQEAVPVAVSAQLLRTDVVFSGHRSHGHYLAKGGDLKAMIAEMYGRETGCAKGKGGSQHLVDLACGFMGSAPILASTIPVAVGAAWAGVMAGEPRLVVSYLGDGATEEGAFHEAMNFASVKRLPVVFVCENNLYSVHSAMDVRQPDRAIHSLAQGHGMPGLDGDGNDVEAVFSLMGQAAERARRGDGPTLIELHTYRLREHCGPAEDGHLGYRDQAEIDAWSQRDPLAICRARLRALDGFGPGDEEAIRDEIALEIDEAFAFAQGSPYPEASSLFADLYGTARA